MKCLDYFGNTSIKEDTSAVPLVTLKIVLSCFKRMEKMIKC